MKLSLVHPLKKNQANKINNFSRLNRFMFADRTTWGEERSVGESLCARSRQVLV